jgi:hypothetical protein
MGSSHDPPNLCLPRSYVWICLFSDGLMLAKQVFLGLSHFTSPQVARIAGMRQVCNAMVIVHLVLHIFRMYQSLLYSADKRSWINEILFDFKRSSCTSPSVFLSQPLCLWHASITHRPRRDLQPAILHTSILHNVLKPHYPLCYCHDWAMVFLKEVV